MDKFIIQGNTPLQGTLPISGSKNAALPLMAGALLADSPLTLTNIPRLKDIYTFNNVLRVTGAHVQFNEQENSLRIDPSYVSHLEAPYDLVRKMRASFYMLGALLGRHGYAKVSLPGGCAWGPRPVDLHIEGLKALGAKIKIENGYVIAKSPNGRLEGGTFELQPSSVGATINIILGAVLAKGTSVIKNAAMEPDVVSFCAFLNNMGAKISGSGTSEITVEGVANLSAADFRNTPDRIETGTWMIAAAMHPESKLTLTGCAPDQLGAFTETFANIAGDLSINGDTISVTAPEVIKPVSVTTEIYPGFPTDLQAQWATMMTLANGDSTVTDTIYTDRFSYVPELRRLGAEIFIKDNQVDIKGPNQLNSATVMSTDLRASVSLVMAAMVAKGQSEVLRIYHLDRGYESLEQKLNAVGAKISRVIAEEEF